MDKNTDQTYKKNQRKWIVTLALIMLVIDLAGLYFVYQTVIRANQSEALIYGKALASDIELNVKNILHSTQTIEGVYVDGRMLDYDRFNFVAGRVLAESPVVDSVFLILHDKVYFAYPNDYPYSDPEDVPGVVESEQENFWKQVDRAKQTQSCTLVGPVLLKNGRTGLIVLDPIILGHTRKCEGFSCAVADWESFVSYVIRENDEIGRLYGYAIWTEEENLTVDEYGFILRSSEKITEKKEKIPVHVPGTTWYLTVELIDFSHIFMDVLPFIVLFTLFTIAVILFGLALMNENSRQHELQKELEVAEKLGEIAEYRDTMISVMHQALRSGMWSMEFDQDGKMCQVSWSQDFREMLGFEGPSDFPDELSSWTDRLHGEDRDYVLGEFYGTIADYSNKKSYDVEYRLLNKAGEWRWYHAMGRLIRRPDGSPRSYVGMFIDINESKEQEQRLQAALREARSASEAKTAFLSHMSHDIRTPINGIMGMTAIALRHMEDRSRVEECLLKIDGSSHHLLSLVNDVLDMSRIEAGKVKVNHEPFDIEAMVGDCASIIQGQLVGRNVTLEKDTAGLTHHRVIGDELHLRQIIINILGNSVKFTNDGDRISIRVRELSSDEQQARYEFIFADTGIGMSEDFLPHLFDSFSQADNGSRANYKGTGLGMAITKQFVEMLGGEIEVESQLNVGTTFRFTLSMDLDLSKDSPMSHLTKDRKDLRGMTILIAEDNEINMEIVVTLLTEEGIQPIQAFNGIEAVQQFEASRPGSIDAILMDVMMDEMDGLEAARRIRSLDREDAKTIPIIATTANAYAEDIKNALAAGMNEHISKPLDMDRLLDLLSEFCHGTGKGKEAEGTIESLAGLHILAAEDNEINAEILSVTLEEEGAGCELARDGAEALRIFKAADPATFDLILLDWNMPVMGGLEAAKEIRALKREDAKTIPIFAMTAEVYPEDAKASLQAGMNGHLTKPLDVQELLGCLRRMGIKAK